MGWFDWFFAPRKSFTFRHECGPVHVVFARDVEEAGCRMRSFLQGKMFGEFALFYDLEAVEREFGKCVLVEGCDN